MVRRSLSTLLLMLILGFAVPALLTDLECMVGRSDCNACSQDSAEVEDCSAPSLAAVDAMALPAPHAGPPATVTAPPRPLPVALERTQHRAPRDGPPPHPQGLRAPPA